MRPDRTHRATVPVRQRSLPEGDLRGTVRRRHRRALRPPHGAAADHRPPSRPGARWPSRPGARPASADAGEQGHAATNRPGTGAGGAADVACDRHRRLGVEARAPLRQHRLRPGTARDRRCASRPRSRHRRGVADGSSRSRDRVAGPRRRLWKGGRPSGAGCGPGRRSLAPDGERQPGIPRRGAAVDDPDPPCARRRYREPGAADRGRAAAARRLPAPRGDQRSRPGLGEGRRADQGDRPPDRLQPADGPAHPPRRARRRLPRPRQFARALAGPTRRSLVRRMPQRRRALASSPPRRLRRQPARRHRMGDPPPACGGRSDFRPPEMPLGPEDRDDADPASAPISPRRTR